VCVFPDGQAFLLIRISNLTAGDGGSLDTWQVGDALRHLKRLQFRFRNIVDVPRFKLGDRLITWGDVLDPALKPFTAAISRATEIGAESRFRSVSFAAIARDPTLRAPDPEEIFDSLRSRLLFELGTGHDTSYSQEVPSKQRMAEIQAANVEQWLNFSAFIFWDDATFFIEDRRTYELSGSEIDVFAEITYPTQVENNFLWIYLLSCYQQQRSLAFVSRLSALSLGKKADSVRAMAISDDFVRYRNLYNYREISRSQQGIAVHRGLTRLFELNELEAAVSQQLESATQHFTMLRAQRTEANERAIRLAVALFGIVGVPASIVASILASQLAQATAIQQMSARDAWTFFIAMIAFLSLLATAFMLFSGLSTRIKERNRREKP